MPHNMLRPLVPGCNGFSDVRQDCPREASEAARGGSQRREAGHPKQA